MMMKTKLPGVLLADESYVREAVLTTCYQTIPIQIPKLFVKPFFLFKPLIETQNQQQNL